MTTQKARGALLLAVFVSLPALAGFEYDPPDPAPTETTSAADAAAAAAAAAAAQAEAAARAASAANAAGIGVGGDGGQGGAGGTASPIVSPTMSPTVSPTMSPSVESNSRVYSFGFSPAARAADSDGCHESWGGKDGTLVKTGGRNVINEPCLKFEQCMERVETYRALGLVEYAVAQLAHPDCGGLPLGADLPPVVVVSAAPDPAPSYVTREEFDRAVEELSTK